MGKPRTLQWTAGVLGMVLSLIGVTHAAAEQREPAYDPAAVVFVTNRDSNDVTVIEIASDEVIDRLQIGAWTGPHMAMLTPDGKSLVVAGTGRNTMIVVDLATQTTQRIPVGTKPEHFDISPDGRTLGVGNLDDGTVSLIDLHELREITRISGFSEPHGVTFLPNGKAYVSSYGSHEVASLDVSSGTIVARLAVGKAYRLAALNPDRYLREMNGIANPTPSRDGHFIYAADGDSGVVGVIDTDTDRVVKTLRVGENPWRAYAAPDGRLMLVPNNGDETVSVIDTWRYQVVATLKAGAGMTGVNFAGTKAYVVASKESAIYVYDLSTFQALKRLKIGTGLKLETASTTVDGEKIYLASSTDNAVYVIETESDTVKRIPNVGDSPWAVTILGGHNYCH